MKIKIIILSLLIIALPACRKSEQKITTISLLYEMTDLARLTQIPTQKYRTIQFSSYDRRSTSPSEPFWFANKDGFGGEPVPGFEQVLKEPDGDGVGEYLICDIQEPGAILRLWTAGISGNIRFFLDDINTPVYEGNAEDFFWKTTDVLSKNEVKMDSLSVFRQFDAVYFPMPFEKRCRIEWIGKIEEIHFYHVGVRVYEQGVGIETFNPEEFQKYLPVLKEIQTKLENPGKYGGASGGKDHAFEHEITSTVTEEIFSLEKGAAIEGMQFRVKAPDMKSALRKSIIRIYFDNSPVPQVEAPLGDFFGTAPGINPFISYPATVGIDSSLQFGLIMPFKNSVRIVIENRSEETLSISGNINTSEYNWEDSSSMHLWVRWKMDHELTAYNINIPDSPISDILYLDVKGAGRIVGAGTHIYNPSNVPTSWGNWWGEGDEKIYIDGDTFPSFFGTGSEDYYNYSWSSARIFSFPYCGQPRNDGPGNRGYVSNFRWHISDDIPFEEKATFYMELGHHGVVPGFSYGRIVYFYALPGLTEEYAEITDKDISDIHYPRWLPEGYGGSAGYSFIQAEEILLPGSSAKTEEGYMWAEGAILKWTPVKKEDQLKLKFNSDKKMDKVRIGFTLSHTPESGVIALLLNGKRIKIDNKDSIDLSTSYKTVLDNHFSEIVSINKGENIIAFEMLNADGNKTIGIDFVWIRQ